MLQKYTKFPLRPTHLPWIVFSGLKQSVCHEFLLDKYTALVQVYLFTLKEATWGFQWGYYKTELLSIITKMTIYIAPSACLLQGFKSVSKNLFKGYEGWGVGRYLVDYSTPFVQWRDTCIPIHLHGVDRDTSPLLHTSSLFYISVSLMRQYT